MRRLPLLAPLLLATCGPIPLGDGPRRQVVRAVSQAVILPTLDELVERTAALESAAAALDAQPSQAALEDARAAWRAARAPWKESEAFGFGPAVELRLAAAIDQRVDPAKVEAEIAGAGPIDAAYVARLGANRKGFHALEHLLFEGGALDALAADPRRRAYAAAVAAELAAEARVLRQAWDGHVQVITKPGETNDAYPTVKAAVDALVNESIFLAEMVADARLGKPLGIAAGGAPQPEEEESGPSDNSLADMASSLRGIRAVYLGARGGEAGRGIAELVRDRSPSTDAALRDALERGLAAIEAVPRPFRAALVDHRDSVESARAGVKELQRLLGSEVVAVLGATLKFNANDGD